jgi:hypothetical protein
VLGLQYEVHFVFRLIFVLQPIVRMNLNVFAEGGWCRFHSFSIWQGTVRNFVQIVELHDLRFR